MRSVEASAGPLRVVLVNLDTAQSHVTPTQPAEAGAQTRYPGTDHVIVDGSGYSR